MTDRAGVVHLPALCELAADVGRGAVSDMIDLFVDSLPERIARLRRAVCSGDAEEARVAALSLSCSAAMLGATRLSDTAQQYARGPRCGQTGTLDALGVMSARELRAARRRLAGDGRNGQRCVPGASR